MQLQCLSCSGDSRSIFYTRVHIGGVVNNIFILKLVLMLMLTLMLMLMSGSHIGDRSYLHNTLAAPHQTMDMAHSFWNFCTFVFFSFCSFVFQLAFGYFCTTFCRDMSDSGPQNIRHGIFSAQRVPEPDPLPDISFDTQPDLIQFWKSSGSG